jgi:hypothetical protein
MTTLRLRRAMILAFCLVGWSAGTAVAEEPAQQRQCRSVHISYTGAEAAAFYNEVTIKQSAPGAYFMVCGWNGGYYGIQEQGDGTKRLLFSVWDSKQNDPKAVPEEARTKLIYKDAKVQIGRFGGEGSGGQSFISYDWTYGATYRLLVTARVSGSRTEYAGYFFFPEEKAWKHLVTFSTITNGKLLNGCYSFVEDFKRDGVSATKVREAVFGNGWLKARDGKWTPITRARFTADSNPAHNINAGVESDRFFLITGGDTRNTGAKLREFINLPPAPARTPPKDLPSAENP